MHLSSTSIIYSMAVFIKDILTSIFKHLPPEVILEKRRVCRVWNLAAQPFIRALLAKGDHRRYTQVFAAGPEKSILFTREIDPNQKKEKKSPADGMDIDLCSDRYNVYLQCFPNGSKELLWRVNLLEPLPDERLRDQSKFFKHFFISPQKFNVIFQNGIVQYWEIREEGPLCTNLVRLPVTEIRFSCRWKKRFLVITDTKSQASIYDLFNACAWSLPFPDPVHKASIIKGPEHLMLYSESSGMHLLRYSGQTRLDLVKTLDKLGEVIPNNTFPFACTKTWMIVPISFSQLLLIHLESCATQVAEIYDVSKTQLAPYAVDRKSWSLYHRKISVAISRDMIICRQFWYKSGKSGASNYLEISQNPADSCAHTFAIHLPSNQYIPLRGEFETGAFERPVVLSAEVQDKTLSIVTAGFHNKITQTYHLDIRREFCSPQNRPPEKPQKGFLSYLTRVFGHGN